MNWMQIFWIPRVNTGKQTSRIGNSLTPYLWVCWFFLHLNLLLSFLTHCFEQSLILVRIGILFFQSVYISLFWKKRQSTVFLTINRCIAIENNQFQFWILLEKVKFNFSNEINNHNCKSFFLYNVNCRLLRIWRANEVCLKKLTNNCR